MALSSSGALLTCSRASNVLYATTNIPVRVRRRLVHPCARVPGLLLRVRRGARRARRLNHSISSCFRRYGGMRARFSASSPITHREATNHAPSTHARPTKDSGFRALARRISVRICRRDDEETFAVLGATIGACQAGISRRRSRARCDPTGDLDAPSDSPRYENFGRSEAD